MPAIIAAFVATVLPTLIVLWWISANPRSVAEIGKSIGDAFGQVGKGVGEGVITPILEYSALAGLLALALGLLYKAAGGVFGAQGLPAPPAPPAFAPPPQFGTSVGVTTGPVRGVFGTTPGPQLPPPQPPLVIVQEAQRRQQQQQRRPRRR